MSKKIYVVSVQPDPEGPVFGRVMDPTDFMTSQDFAHGHVEQITRDLLVAGAAGAQVAGFEAALTSGLSVEIAKGDAVDQNGICYETDEPDDDPSLVTMTAAHVSLPRIDLIVATLAIDTPVGSEFNPFRRLRTQAELEAEVAPYPPTQYETPTELHSRAVISVKTGVPNASPAAPVAGAGEVGLWRVHVAAGQANLGGGDLTDVRPLMKSLYQVVIELAAANVAIAALNAGAELLIRKGVANGYAALDSGGKVPFAQIPAIAISETYVVASQAAMLALAAERGDVAIRTDINQSFILSAEPATTLGNWKQLLFPAPVTSFNTRTGAITLLLADVTTALGFTPVNKAGDSMTGALSIAHNITNAFALNLIGNSAGGGLAVDIDASVLLARFRENGTDRVRFDASTSQPLARFTKAFNDAYLVEFINTSGGRQYGVYIGVPGTVGHYPTLTLESSLGILLNIFADNKHALGLADAVLSGTGKVHMGGDCFRVNDSRSPASNATGNAGEYCWDANFLYVCVATNTWKRAALTGGY